MLVVKALVNSVFRVSTKQKSDSRGVVLSKGGVVSAGGGGDEAGWCVAF